MSFKLLVDWRYQKEAGHDEGAASFDGMMEKKSNVRLFQTGGCYLEKDEMQSDR